jgi:hypothetical protein
LAAAAVVVVGLPKQVMDGVNEWLAVVSEKKTTYLWPKQRFNRCLGRFVIATYFFRC